MDWLRHDLRHAVRSLVERPGFSATAVLTLGLGIGVTTVAFNAINALVLRPFRVDNADRVGWIRIEGTTAAYGQATVTEFEYLASASTSFDAIAAEGRLPVSLQTPDGARQAWAALVSTNYLETVGARPEVGRLFNAGDLTGSELPVIVSHRFWKETLGASRSIGGQTIVVNGRAFSVIGVLPDDYQGRGGLFSPDMWLPLARSDVLNLPTVVRDDDRLLLFGHLREGVERARAIAELDALSRQWPSASLLPGTHRAARFYPMDEGHPEVREVARFAWLALATVSVVLLLACFNVAALLMARANERQHEIGIRVALGAGRARILSQLITEGIALAVLAGTATLVLASWSGDLLATFSLPAPIPQRIHLGPDRTLVGFTALVVLIAGVAPALVPALQATQREVLASFRPESTLGAAPSRLRNALVVAQVAGSTLFLVAALLLVRSFLKNAAFDTGFDTTKTLVMQVNPAMYGYEAGAARVLVENLESRLRSLPEVVAVGVSDRIPISIGMPNRVEYSAGEADCAVVECRRAVVFSVAPGHFEALGVPLVDGRDFTAIDMGREDPVIVSDHLARQMWPGGSAVGRTFLLGETGRRVTIAGVTRDIRNRYVAEGTVPHVYRPMSADHWAAGVTVVIRTAGDPRDLLAATRDQLHALDKNLPVRVDTTAELMKLQLWPARTAAGFFLICGVLATLLATVGLFGVLYFTVLQRSREFGIRAALGATPGRVVHSVVCEGLALVVPGVALGSVAAYVAARLMSRALFGVSPADPLSFSAAAAIEFVVAIGACAVPAFRASNADPMVALRDH